MRRNKLIKHSSMVVAALLAVAPVLSNNVAYAGTGNQTAKTEQGKKAITSTPGDSIDNPIKLTSKVTTKSVKIKYKDGLKASDVAQYVVKNMFHEYADSSEVKHPSGAHSLHNADGKPIYINKINQGAVHTGDTVKVHPTISSGLEPNTWYSWTSNENPYNRFGEFSKDTGKFEYNLPDEIKDRSSVVSIGKNQYKVSVKTDDKGNLIRVRVRSANKVNYERDNVIDYSSPETVTATIVDPSDKDGVDIPLVTQTTKPYTPTKSDSKPTNTEKPTKETKPSDTKDSKPDSDSDKPNKNQSEEPQTNPITPGKR